MIAKLRGIIDSIGEDYAIIDVNGVGYLVYASAKTLSRLAAGAEVSLLIETVVRKTALHYLLLPRPWRKNGSLP